MVSCDTFIPCVRFSRYTLVMGHRNKQQIQLEAISQARRYLSSKNEDLEIVDRKTEPGNDMLEIYTKIFSSVIQSNLNNRPLYYSGDSDHMN